MNDDSHANREIVRAFSRQCQIKIRISLNVPSPSEDRVVVEFNQPQINAITQSNIDASANFHGETCHAIVQDKIKWTGGSLDIV